MSFSKGRKNNTAQLCYQWVHWITRVWIFKPLLDFKTSYLHEDLFVLNFQKLSLMAASIRLAATYHLVSYGETMVWRKMKTICLKMTHSWRYNCSSGYFGLKIERMWETPQVPVGPSQTHHSQTIHCWWYISRCGFLLRWPRPVFSPYGSHVYSPVKIPESGILSIPTLRHHLSSSSIWWIRLY